MIFGKCYQAVTLEVITTSVWGYSVTSSHLHLIFRGHREGLGHYSKTLTESRRAGTKPGEKY